jgi:hypothetical protein
VDGGALRNWESRGGKGQILYGFVLVMVNILDLRSCHEPFLQPSKSLGKNLAKHLANSVYQGSAAGRGRGALPSCNALKQSGAIRLRVTYLRFGSLRIYLIIARFYRSSHR